MLTKLRFKGVSSSTTNNYSSGFKIVGSTQSFALAFNSDGEMILLDKREACSQNSFNKAVIPDFSHLELL